jgi:WD40 repeat protein/transcriptional regulator with XRE-family HTH domain
VAEQPGLNFAGLLRQLRTEAKLTQEELAEAASLSPRSVSDLERGVNHTARKDTAVLLAGALGLAGPAGELFVAAARGKAPAAQALAAVRSTGPVIASPYRGLNVFEEQDAAFFFGREAATAAVLERMSRLLGEPGLLVVSGVSGAGKSSLLRAGVLPRIREAGLVAAPEAVSWPCLVFTPTRAPLDELALRVAALAAADAAAVRQGLEAAPAWFALTARQAALARPPGPGRHPDGPAARRDQPPRQQRLLLVVDQFEEVFTQCADEEQRRAFITALHAAGSAGHGPDQTPGALVILGVRADFEARCADYPQLAGPVQDRYLVTSMTERQLRAAITEPAKMAGSKVDDDLTSLLLTEVGNGQPGAFGAGVLPLLSHALDQAWRCRTGDAVTLTDYERAGGIEGAVAGSAQRAYEHLTPAQQAAARRVFLRLTATSSDGVDTAARATRAELTGGTGAAQAQDVEAVLEAFAAERLITLAAGTVEISHEALLTAWPLLRDTWLADTHADRIVRTRLHNSATEWDRHSCDPSYLYSGSLLQAAADTAARIGADPARHPPLSQTERDFLYASDHAHRRRARRRQGLIGLLAVLVIGLASATVVAVHARQQATHQLHVVSSRLLINESRLVGDAHPDLSKLLAVAAWQIDPSSAARSAMLAAAARPGIAILGGYSDAVLSVAFGPDGKTLATGDNDGTVQLWDVAARQQIGLPLSSTGAVNAVAFSPDGKTLATGSADGTVRSWDLAISLPAGPLQAFGGTVTSRSAGSLLFNGHTSVIWVAFSSDGKILATGDSDGTVQRWVVATRHPIGAPFTVEAGQVDSMALSPDGKTVATGSADGKVRLWDIATRRQLQLGYPGIGQGSPVYSVAFSPNGKTLASGSASDTVQLWDMATRQPTGLPLINGHAGIDSVTFSPDSKTLATGDADGTVQLWGVTTRQQIGGPYAGHGGSVTSVTFSPDGKTLASGSDDQTVRLWNVATPGQNLAGATNLVRYLCALAGRPLTPAEWAQYVPALGYQAVCP